MRRLAWTVAAILLVAAPAARAEPVGPLVHDRDAGETASGDVAAYTSVGLDGAMSATFGVAAGVGPLGARTSTAVFADVTWAAGQLDLDDVRLRAAVRADALRAGPFRLRIAVAPELVDTRNEAFVARSLGTELRVAPGVDSGRWSAELDLSLDQKWLTYIAPSDTYRAEVYATPRDGWYATTARTFRVGPRAAARFGGIELSLAAGWERTASLDFLPPVYAALGIAYVHRTSTDGPSAAPTPSPAP